VAATLFDPLVEVVLQRGHFVQRQHTFHHQEAVALELFDLCLFNHGVFS
jgi:hypothetical protein